MKTFRNNKKIFIIALTFTVLAISGLAGVLFLNNKSEATVDLNTFTLVNDSGTIEYKLSNGANFEKVEKETTLPSGTSIKTSDASLAYVFFPDNSLVTIEANTEITIQVEENKINIDQIIGNTWHRVQTVTNGGEYNVKTPDTIASVRGTIFAVKAQPEDGTNVYVVESNVDVAGSGLIPANKYAQVQNYNEIKVGTIEEETKNSEWFGRNTEVDTLYEQNDRTNEAPTSFREKVMENIKDNNEKKQKENKGVLGASTEKKNLNTKVINKDESKKKKIKIFEEKKKEEEKKEQQANENTNQTNQEETTTPTINEPTVISSLSNPELSYDVDNFVLKVSWTETNVNSNDKIIIKDLTTGEILGQDKSRNFGGVFKATGILPIGQFNISVCLNDCSVFSRNKYVATAQFKIEQVDGNYFGIYSPNEISLQKYYDKGYKFYFDLSAGGQSKKQPVPVENQNYMNLTSLLRAGGEHKVRMCVYKDSNLNGTPDTNEECIGVSNTLESVYLY